MKTDWHKLHNKLFPGEKSGSTSDGLAALEHIMGDEWCIDLVEQATTWTPGGELARMVLLKLHPWSSQLYCYDRYKNETDYEHKKEIMFVLKHLADRRTIPWLKEFYYDDDPFMKIFVIDTIDQLIFSGEAGYSYPEIKPLVDSALRSDNKYLHLKAKIIIRDYRDMRKRVTYSNKLYRISGKLKIKWDEEAGLLMKPRKLKKRKSFKHKK